MRHQPIIRQQVSDLMKFCLVTNMKSRTIDQYLSFLAEAIKGGVTIIQLREKLASSDEMREKALAIHKFLKPYNIPLILNDNVLLAAEINAEGVHLGQDDMSVACARKIIGEDKIIGLSIENLDQLMLANEEEGIDYVSASAIFPTPTKPDCKSFWGIDGLKKFVSSSTHNVMAIGGINHENIAEIIKAGAKGVAVIGAIHNHKNPRFAATQIMEALNDHKNYV